MGSSIVQKIPFLTSVMHVNGSLQRISQWNRENPNLGGLEDMIEQLAKYESKLFGFTGTSRALSNMQGILGITSVQSSQQHTSKLTLTKWSAQEATQATALICAYKLVDVYTFINEIAPLHTGPIRRGIMESSNSTLSPILDPLADWPSVLINFRDQMARSKAQLTLDVGVSLLPHVRLFKQMTTVQAGTDFSKVLHNFLAAALHLAFLKMPSADQEAIPDIPDDCMTNENLMPGGFTTHFDGAEAQYFKTVCSSTSKGGAGALRAALQFALLVSPLVLFVPKKFTKKGWNRKYMLDTCLTLGTMKPALILSIERAVWTTIFRMALGVDDPVHLLINLVSTLPWLQIESCRQTGSWDRYWFDTRPVQEPEAAKSMAQLTVQQTEEGAEEPLEEGEIREFTHQCDLGEVSQICSPPLDIDVEMRHQLQQDDQVGRQQSAKPSEHEGHYTQDQERSNEHDSETLPNIEGSDQHLSFEEGDKEELRVDSELESKDEKMSSTESDQCVPQEDSDEAERDEEDLANKDTVDREDVVMVDRPSRRLRERIRKIDGLIARNPFRGTPTRTRKRRRVVSATVVEEEELLDSTGEDEPIFLGEGTSDVPFLLEELWEPVDLDEFKIKEEDTDGLNQPPSRPKFKSDDAVTFFGPYGKKYEYKPVFHYPDLCAQLQQYSDSVELHYDNGQPRHLYDPDNSAFKIISKSNFEAKTEFEVTAILRNYHIVIPDYKREDIMFASQTLCNLQPLKNNIVMRDYSNKTDTGYALVSGTLQDIIDNEGNEDGRVLEGLDVPRWRADMNITAFATELVAWEHTRGKPGSGHMSEFPVGHMRCATVSMEGSMPTIGMNGDGLNVSVDCVVGKKLVIVGVGDDGSVANGPENLEAIVLPPGSRIVIRANTRMTMCSMSSGIVNLEYFYSTVTMKETNSALMHTFLNPRDIINSSHLPSRSLLRQTAHFYYLGLVEKSIDTTDQETSHLPRMDLFKGVLDLLSLCNAVIFGNVLDPRTYRAPNQRPDQEPTAKEYQRMIGYDLNALSRQEREAACFARGISLQILQWFNATYLVQDTRTGNEVPDPCAHLLATQAAAMIRQKGNNEEAGIVAVPHCTTELLSRQLINVLELYPPAITLFYDGDSNSTCTSSMAYDEDTIFYYKVERRAEQREYPRTQDFRRLGLTRLDKLYFKGLNMRIHGVDGHATSTTSTRIKRRR